jgi:hypothetical protein
MNVTGGTPPYTWSTPTKGVLEVSGSDNQNAKVRAPANPNWNQGGIAYTLGSFTYALEYPYVATYQWKDYYGCNDNWIYSGNTGACYCGLSNCPTISWQVPPQFSDSLMSCGDRNASTCNGHSLPQVLCTNDRLIDGRGGQLSQQTSTCNPCGISMQGGATLSVQDSTGATIPVTIKVNVP